jgi:opacity protein-like surface antigen
MARQTARCGVLAIVLLTAATAAVAQEAVRVTAREAPIRTRPDDHSPMVGRAVAGTVLQVVATEQNWYLVVIPAHVRLVPTAPDQGYIDARAVTLLPPGDPRATGARPGTARKPGAAPPAAPGPGLRWRLFGSAAFEQFQAKESFDAVFGSPSAPVFGGGFDVLVGRHLFVQADAGFVRRTGERVFVFEGEVFPLGIDEKMQLTTIAINAGYRFGRGGRVTPYVGGGGVAAFYREEATGTEGAGQEFSKNGVGGQAIGGVEFRVSRWFSTAVEGRYRYLPGIIGDDGVSREFSEDNLGGAAVGIKLLIGR